MTPAVLLADATTEVAQRNAIIRLLAARGHGAMPTVATGKCHAGDGEPARVRVYAWSEAPAGDLVGGSETDLVGFVLITGPAFPARILPADDLVALSATEWMIAPPTPPDADEIEPLYLPPIYRLTVANAERVIAKMAVFPPGDGRRRLTATIERANMTDETKERVIKGVEAFLNRPRVR
jgi:hypothetical protein